MYEKILKETASQLTLLIAGNDGAQGSILDKSLSGFFKKIYHASTANDSMARYRQERCNLVLIDIDFLLEDSYRIIDEIQKLDGQYASIVAYSRQSNDSELLYKLLNVNISGFLKESSKPEDMYQVLSKICDQALDKKVMHVYLREMENICEIIAMTQRNHTLCSEKIRNPLPPTLTYDDSAILLPQQVQTQSVAVELIEDDDFEFFPLFEVSSVSPCLEIDNSMYEDYYSYLEHDDKEELIDQLNEIDATLYNAFTDDGANVQYISRLGSSLMRYGNVLLHYQFFSDMGASILELGKLIIDECDHVVGEAKNFELLVSAFCSGLQTFMAEVWENNSDNPKLFNDSILSDTRTIVAMFTPAVVADDSDDLIFF